MLTMLKRLVSMMLLLIMLWAAGFVWFVMQIPTSPSADAQHSDAIVVLTGGSLRLEHGLKQLIDGKADKLFVSGVKEGVSLTDLLHNKEVIELLPRIPLARVELGFQARSTLQNAEETKAWVNKNQIKSFRLITGNYHTPRSLYVMHKAMPEIIILPDPVFPAEFKQSTWWSMPNAARLVLSEYHKYMASMLADMLGITAEE